jgi:type VI secretion system secreted protein Hcp
MKKNKILGIVALSALIVAGIVAAIPLGGSEADPVANPPNTSGVEMYINFEGIDGEAQDKDHKGWSDLASFNHDMSNPTIEGRSGRRRGDVVLEDIVLVKELDKSTPKIQESMTNGRVFPKVELHVTEYYAGAGRVTYLKYELTNVMVTSHKILGPSDISELSGIVGSSDTRDIPTESMSLNFEKIKVTYTEFDSSGKSKGNVEFSWNVEEGQP